MPIDDNEPVDSTDPGEGGGSSDGQTIVVSSPPTDLTPMVQAIDKLNITIMNLFAGNDGLVHQLRIRNILEAQQRVSGDEANFHVSDLRKWLTEQRVFLPDPPPDE